MLVDSTSDLRFITLYVSSFLNLTQKFHLSMKDEGTIFVWFWFVFQWGRENVNTKNLPLSVQATLHFSDCACPYVTPYWQHESSWVDCFSAAFSLEIILRLQIRKFSVIQFLNTTWNKGIIIYFFNKFHRHFHSIL